MALKKITATKSRLSVVWFAIDEDGKRRDQFGRSAPRVSIAGAVRSRSADKLLEEIESHFPGGQPPITITPLGKNAKGEEMVATRWEFEIAEPVAEGADGATPIRAQPREFAVVLGDAELALMREYVEALERAPLRGSRATRALLQEVDAMLEGAAEFDARAAKEAAAG